MIYGFDGFQVDTDQREISGPDGPIAVQPQVFSLLVFLIENRDRVVPKDEVIAEVWKRAVVSDSTLNARINALRRAFGDDGQAQRVIRTLPRQGFRFVAEVAEDVAGARADEGARALTDQVSLLVMPFQNLSGQTDQDFLADGIAEDLITGLATLRGVQVIGRSSAFSFKDQDVSSVEAARRLGVWYVLEGSVQTAGQRLRVTARLLDARSQVQVWAGRYDRVMEDIFDIQDDVTASVVGRIGPELYEAENQRIRRKPPQNLDSWECFARALNLYSQQSQETSAEALELLRRAVELDPDYAQAHAVFALTLAWRAVQRWEPSEAIDEAMTAAELAIELDPHEAWCHMARGMVATHARKAELGISSFRQALQLSPNFAYAHAVMGAALAYSGQAEASIASVDRAIELSPRDGFLDKFHLYHSLAYFQAARYDAAAEAAERAILLKPKHANTYMIQASALALAGRQAEAEKALGMFISLVPGTTVANVEKAIAYTDKADRDRLTEGLIRAGLT